MKPSLITEAVFIALQTELQPELDANPGVSVCYNKTDTIEINLFVGTFTATYYNIWWALVFQSKRVIFYLDCDNKPIERNIFEQNTLPIMIDSAKRAINNRFHYEHLDNVIDSISQLTNFNLLP